ncbi:alginate lyase family protein [Streptomyces scopuliridis]|uniref:alginate lyase family protein n=1 Tax=Streptomyces scopuliridis TaxID=452529 RepID=UPI0004C13505|nr:alginate lyase family protein [Streptomyces scopuliridis]
MSRDTDITTHRMSRRSLLRTAGGLAAAGALGGATAALNGNTAGAAPATFTHPGMLHAYGELNRAKVQVAAGKDPWLSGWNRLTANSHSASSWKANPQATIIRGGTGENYGILYNDIHAAYQNALRWKIAGTTAHGDTARDILNAWSAKLTSLAGNADRFLAAGIYGYQFANAAELMRGYSGFDLNRFKTMMLNVFYPMNNDFLLRHNDACITNYWANWDLCNMNSILAIAILCDDGAKYDQAVNYFKNGAGNGSINRAVPFLYDSQGLAQWQESGRDQGHTMMGMGQMGAFCEMAWNQGDDLYGYGNNRFMKAAEYVAKYNLGNTVPFTTYTWGTGQNCAQMSQTVISDNSRGQVRPVWDQLHYHYAGRRGLSVPYITQMAGKGRPEGGGGDYGSASGGFDQLGFGTLMYAR